VAFADRARLTGDAPLGGDSLVYRRDLEAGVTSYVDQGGAPSLSGDGKTLAYQSPEGQVWAVTDGKPELISATSSGEQGNGRSGQPDVNADGSLIAFASEASNLGPGSENKGRDIFLRKRSGDPSTELVSLDDRSRPGSGSFAFPALSDDGRWVAFRSEADINGCLQETSVEVRDRGRESTFRAARGLGNQLPNGLSDSPSVAGDGSVVGFSSTASNLVDGDDNDGPDGFLTELGAIDDPVVFTSKGPPRANETAGDLVFSYAVCQRAGRQEPFEFGFQTADGTATRDKDYLAAESTNRFEGTVTGVIASGTDPAVSRDGKRLAFIRHKEGSPDELMIAGADGFDAESVLVAHGVGDGFGLGRPAWSPDGSRLAVTDFAGGTADIAVVTDFETDTAETLLDNAGELGHTLSYSPDGTKLAFDQDGLVTTLDVDSGAVKTVASGVDPSYGPDGALVYTRSDPMRILPEGGEESNFIPAKATGEPSEFGDLRPAYSPDGSAIVFVREAGGKSWIDSAPLAGGTTTRLTSGTSTTSTRRGGRPWTARRRRRRSRSPTRARPRARRSPSRSRSRRSPPRTSR
jgi:Tol biopolymer transport system component